jgi:uroporphyrinogen decarboxylase
VRLLDALARTPLDRPPVWFMRQAGRYLPEYRDVRSRYTFQEAVHTPAVAAELTMQPIRRFDLDAAIIFADIMTPLEGMGVEVEFDPGPRLKPCTVADVGRLPSFRPESVGFVAEAVSLVRRELDVPVIGFAGGPVTLLAYLLEGGGNREFMHMRAAMEREPDASTRALTALADAMNAYLRMQIDAGAQVVQLFDSWAGLLSRDRFTHFAVPAARRALQDLGVPTIYFAPHAGHDLDLFTRVEATGYGVDWRIGIDEAWRKVGADQVLQGNLDPAILLSDPDTIRAAVHRILTAVAGRRGHVFNLGHGIHRTTPVGNVAAMVNAVKESA